jgi:serine phosphatase RsbU (regulator of sigma subunit)
MSANRENSAAALNEGLMARVSEYCDAQFQDDATLVVIAVY